MGALRRLIARVVKRPGPTPFQIRQLQRALNSFFARYDLHQPHLAVDSIYGARTAEESRWAQWLMGVGDASIGHLPIDRVTWWLAHPAVFYATHPAGYRIHRARLAKVRAPAYGGHNLTRYAGLVIASWIAPKMERHGMAYGIPGDQLCAWRGPVGSGLQAYIFKRYLAGVERGPVAPPGDSMHEYCDCSWCRARIAERFGINRSDAIGGAVDAADPYTIADAELAPAGEVDPPHASSRLYQNATGRF